MKSEKRETSRIRPRIEGLNGERGVEGREAEGNQTESRGGAFSKSQGRSPAPRRPIRGAGRSPLERNGNRQSGSFSEESLTRRKDSGVGMR